MDRPGQFRAAISSVLVVIALASSSAEAQHCPPVVDFYPVRGRHNHGYDSTAGDSSMWSCDDAHSNSDFIFAGGRHVGNDVWAVEGTPVVAVSAGRVGFAGHESYPGWNVHIVDDCGWDHWAGHLQSIAPGLVVGSRIEAGTVIGYVGRSGVGSNGVVHLHYSIHPPGDYYNGIDPWPHLHAVERDVCGPASSGDTLLNEQPVAYAAPSTTDIDGDGRSDVCARGSAGVMCWPATESGWGEMWAPIPWSDSSGWNHPSHYATLRMGDVDGDGRADVCARSSTDFLCSTSNGAGFDAHATWREGTSNANGWNLPRYYTGMRLVDVDGDGKDDLCARDSAGFGCWLSDGSRFDQRIEGPRWSDDAGFALPQYYGTLRMGDIDGDGRADVCIRGVAGIGCALSDGEGFPTEIAGPPWGDAQGFGAIQYWSTLRMADVNGDDRADLCIRTGTDLRCHFSTGDGFGDAVIVGALSDANGWNDVTNYTTLRTGDIDGDGATDLCARADTVVGCWVWNGAELRQIDGPPLSDESGWAAGPHYYETLRLADTDGDGMADLCARAGDGWRCHPSRGDSFGEPVLLGDLADGTGWRAPQYFTTIMSAGVGCRAEAEVCNGEDDDCDGVVDEDDVCSLGADGGAYSDGGTHSDAASGGSDAGETPDGGARDALQPGCSCRAGTAGDDTRAWFFGLSLVLGLVWRKRRA